MEPKLLKAETEEYLKNLGWPGNVRQLENTCRWITVMASGREVHIDDLPPELLTQPQDSAPAANWEQALRQWADQALGRGQSNLLDSAVPAFERIMIETALAHRRPPPRCRRAARLGPQYPHPQDQGAGDERRWSRRRRRRLKRHCSHERPNGAFGPRF